MIQSHVGRKQIAVPQSCDSPKFRIEIFAVQSGERRGDRSDMSWEAAAEQLQALCQTLATSWRRAIAMTCVGA